MSGEALLGEKEFGIDYDILNRLAREIAEAKKLGVEVILVIGAGNIWRGARNDAADIERVPSDYIGMLATIMNSIAMQAALEKLGVETRVASALDIPSVAEPYILRRALRHLEKGRIVICAGGTGNPFFTTDSAAALRALELGCDAVLKGTNVEGIYDKDPRTNTDAVLYDTVTFDEVLEKDLKVMDATAIAQCRDNAMPIVVFELMGQGNIKRVIAGNEPVGTRVVAG